MLVDERKGKKSNGQETYIQPCLYLYLYGDRPFNSMGKNPDPKNENANPYPALVLTISNQKRHFQFFIAVADFYKN